MKTKLLILFLVLLTACNTGNKPMTEAQKEAIKGEGSISVNEFFNAIMESNGGILMELCEKSPDFNMVVAGEIYTYDGMKEMVDQVLPLVKEQTFRTKSEKYVIIDPTCFLYIWHGRNGIYMKSGDSTVYDDYIGTYAFRKVEESWKLFFGHESYKVPFPIDTTTVQATN